MDEYKAPYYFIFNGITDIINDMKKMPEPDIKHIQYLELLQMGAEEIFISQEDNEE